MASLLLLASIAAALAPPALADCQAAGAGCDASAPGDQEQAAMLQLRPGQGSRVKSRPAQQGREAREKKKVIFIQDACLDDFLAIAALARAHKAGEIEWLGDVLVNADSVLPQSMDLTQTFHHDLGVTDVPVLLSRIRLFNAFPWLYRNDTWAMTTLDTMKAAMGEAEENGGLKYTKMDCGGCPEEYPDAHPWLVDTLANASDGSITLLTVATQTILKPVFEEHPELQAKVKEMVWMAGAINVRGNTENTWEPWATGHGYSGMNHYAEWNVYGDAYAAKWIMEHATYPIYDFPLDVCDKIPVCNEVSCEFIQLMNGSMEEPLITGSDCPNGLIFDALVGAYEKFAAPAPFYRLWDSAATAYVLAPDLFLDEGETPLACITDWGYEGWLAQPGAPASKGLEEPEIYKNVTVFFNLTSPADETRNKLYRFLASAACGTELP